jgi:hypothetical protein
MTKQHCTLLLLCAALCWGQPPPLLSAEPVRTIACEQPGSDVDTCAGGFISQQLVQAGWWFNSLQGSPDKVAQYQDLDSSPFWSFDSFHADGTRTWDVFATGLDQEANDLRVGLALSDVIADIQYQRYIDHTEPDRLLNFPQPVPEHAHPGSDPTDYGQYAAEDRNVGDDYATRIQQLRAKFHGPLTDQAKWRLNVWSLRKSGHRQALALSNSYDRPDVYGNCQACHVLSQRQEIDWRTVEVEPVVETRQGPFSIAFSLPVRSFTQNDQAVSRLYNPPPANDGGAAVPPQLGSESYPEGEEYAYGLVPENLTQIRKLKIGVDLGPSRQLVALLHHGSTDNQFRNVRRNFSGADLRLIDRPAAGISWTGYARYTQQDNPLPSELIGAETLEFDRYDESEEPCLEDISRSYGGCGCAPLPTSCTLGSDGVSDFFASDALADPVDYYRTTLGWNGRWKPFGYDCGWKRGLTCYGRYEFRLLQRGDAEFEAAVEPGETIVLDQSESHRHTFQLGMSQRWARTLDSFLRYRTWYESDPLFGVRETNAVTNSSLPTHAQRIEIGGTWSPWDALIASGTLGLENQLHDSEIADFDQWDWPLTVTLWYAPAPAFWFTAGYAYSANTLQQAITLGDDFQDGGYHAPVTEIWGYRQRSHVASLGCLWRRTPRLSWRGSVQFIRGINGLDSTIFEPRFVWPAIEDVVRNDRTSLRLSAGCDYAFGPRTTGYVRYNYLDYDDAVIAYNSGTAHLLLAGLSTSY